MDISDIVRNFRVFAGNNYRVEKDKPEEKARYNGLNKAGANRDNNDNITLKEYLEYLQKTKPELQITQVDLQYAENIDGLMNNKAPFLREYFATTLGIPGNKLVVPALIDAMKDENPFVRSNVVSALGRTGDKIAVNIFIEALKNDNNKSVRGYAAFYLGELGDRSAIPALKNAMQNDVEWDVRISAAAALGHLGEKSGFTALTEALKNERDDWRIFTITLSLESIQKTLTPNDPTYQEIERALKASGQH